MTALAVGKGRQREQVDRDAAVPAKHRARLPLPDSISDKSSLLHNITKGELSRAALEPQRNMVKIMMPPEVMNSIAGALIAKQVLREIVRRAVKTPSDEHYFAVMMHRGISEDLHHIGFGDLAKLMDCPTSTVHRHIAEHMLSGSARGGCKFCNGASRGLRLLIIDERKRDRKTRDPFSVFITLDRVTAPRRRAGQSGMGKRLVPVQPLGSR